MDNKTNKLVKFKTYHYNNSRPNLIKEIEKKIVANNSGAILGQWCYLTYVIMLSNSSKKATLNIEILYLAYNLLTHWGLE